MTNQSKALVVGLDIGGANLKAALTSGAAASMPFPMWTHFDQTGSTVRQLVQSKLLVDSSAPSLDGHTRLRAAVTMTGELSDCFSTRRQGVKYILEQIESCGLFADIAVYGVDGVWRSVREAMNDPWNVAASNWAAQARWILQSDIALPPNTTSRACGLLLDVGSTTTDIIPFANGELATNCRTDRDRLQNQQLIYTGLERTPVAAIVRQVDVAGVACPVMAEHFATTKDVYVYLDLAAEDPSDTATADGQPLTKLNSANRLARMIGEDIESLAGTVIRSIAEQIHVAQAAQIAAAVLHNLRRISTTAGSGKQIVVTGHGNSLIRLALQYVRQKSAQFTPQRDLEQLFDNVFWMDARLSPAISRSAPAFAVAWLAEKEEVF